MKELRDQFIPYSEPQPSLAYSWLFRLRARTLSLSLALSLSFSLSLSLFLSLSLSLSLSFVPPSITEPNHTADFRRVFEQASSKKPMDPAAGNIVRIKRGSHGKNKGRPLQTCDVFPCVVCHGLARPTEFSCFLSNIVKSVRSRNSYISSPFWTP